MALKLTCCVLLAGVYMSAAVASGQTADILVGAQLSPGLDMGVNSSGGKTDWLSNDGSHMTMSYPAGQSWGAVFITVGKPTAPPRPSRDMSEYDTLSVEMKGASGGEQIEIGVKTNTQPDDGSETKVPIKLTSEWHTYTFALNQFIGVDLKSVYVMIEFVFSGADSQEVQVRNVRYLKEANEQSQGPGAGPKVTISGPGEQCETHVWSGNRASIFITGTASGLVEGDRLVLVVHPLDNDMVWVSEIPAAETRWVGQAFFGGSGGLPKDKDAYEVLAAVMRTKPPDGPVSLRNIRLFAPSNTVAVKVNVTSWFDRAVAYGSNLQVSAPITALIAAVGTIGGNLLGRRQGKVAAANASTRHRH